MKLVREHINFQRGLDPKDAMQTGDVEGRRREKIKEELRRAAKILVYDLKVKKESVKENFDNLRLNSIDIQFKGKFQKYPYTQFFRDCVYWLGYNFITEEYCVGIEVYKNLPGPVEPEDESTVHYFKTIGECMNKIRFWAKIV